MEKPAKQPFGTLQVLGPPSRTTVVKANRRGISKALHPQNVLLANILTPGALLPHTLVSQGPQM